METLAELKAMEVAIRNYMERNPRFVTRRRLRQFESFKRFVRQREREMFERMDR